MTDIVGELRSLNEQQGHTTLATCAASIAIREAARAGVPSEQHRLIGMRAGWAVLEGLGYDIPDALRQEMAMVATEAI